MKTLKNMTFQNKLLGAAVVSAALAVSPAYAQDDAKLNQELLRDLQKQLQELKAENAAVKTEVNRLKAAKASGNTAFVPENPEAIPASPADGPITYNSKTGFIHFPGADTKIKVGGYLKADAIYDISSSRTGGGQDFFQPATIPLDGTAGAADNNFRLHARQTRVNLTSVTKTSLGDLKLFIEGDFYGTDAGTETATNGYTPQLRHAYGEIGSFLFGQTWSNWMDLDAYPETVDYVGPAGISLVRQGQVRYTHSFDANNKLAVAVENPASLDVVATGGGAAIGADEVPDLTARYTYTGDWGFVSLKGVARRNDITTTPGGSDDDWGYGVGVAGKFNTWGKDNLKYQIAYGEGLGRYIYDIAASAAAGTSSGTTGEIELAEVIAGYVAYQHHWADQWRSNLILGHTEIDNDAAAGLDLNERVQSAEANLIWQPLPRYQTGISYLYGHRETTLGNEGDLNRVQWSNWFLF